MTKKRILIIENDTSIYHSIRESMLTEHTEVDYARSATEALDTFMMYEYCLAIISIEVSNAKDMEALKIIRHSKAMPIFALTSSLTAAEKIALFHAGANAVLEKPVDPIVCVAQANSLIQLYAEAQAENRTCHPLIFGTELIIDPIYRQVIIEGEQLVLTRKEFDLLLCLARHPGQIWSRTQLYSQVWSDDLGLSGENTVRAHIGNIRKKLADIGKNYIQTSWGVGYKFVPPTTKQ